MAKVKIKIEGVAYQVEEGLTILEAAKACGYEIPSLCAFNHGECSSGSCRVCLVEIKGARGLVASCVYPVGEGMEVTISSPKASEARRASVELLLSNHNQNCQQCDKNGKCELLHVAGITGAREGRYLGTKTPVTGKMVAALKRLGFHKVYDTNFAADLTIMEEGTELLGRIRNGGKPIYSMNRLQTFCQCYDISIGIITVPAEHAQEAYDRLVECDIEAVWNFSPAHPNVPDSVVVQSENLAVSLTALRMQIKNRYQ